MATALGHSRDSSTQAITTPQTGSVIEVMFAGHGTNRGYLATSYPYPPKDRHDERIIATEGLPDDMEAFLAKGKHTYIINASANANDCWIFVYWTTKGEYDEYIGGDMEGYPEMMQRLFDFQKKSRGKVRSTAFGSGEETIFLRASNGEHHWSFRWKDLPSACEMMIQDSIQQSGWEDRRFAKGKEGKKIERVEYYPHEDANKRAPGCIRFLTLGKNDGWIIYGETWHIWDKTKGKLPPALVKGLEMGRNEQWIINKVELSLFEEDEYVLVYDQGPVFYHLLSPKFEKQFKQVVEQWADSKGVRAFYNKDVDPVKIRSRNVQSFVVPPEDDESTTSRRTPPSSTNGTIPPYAEAAPRAETIHSTEDDALVVQRRRSPPQPSTPDELTTSIQPAAGSTDSTLLGPQERVNDSSIHEPQHQIRPENQGRDRGRGHTPRQASGGFRGAVRNLVTHLNPDRNAPQ